MRFWQRILAALAIGGIVGFASEMLFHVTPEPALEPRKIPFTWLFNSATAWLCLGVRSWVSLFLIGCIFGWVIEGVVVATVYDALPWAIPFTAMGWHAMVSGLFVLGASRIAVRWPWRHFLFMLMPILTALIATQGWQRLQNIESNGPIALLLTAFALGIYLFAAIAAVRTPL